MIKKTLKGLQNLFGRAKRAANSLSGAPSQGSPKRAAAAASASHTAAAVRCVYEQKQHGIAHKLVDHHAAAVCETLQQAGFQAYIVGGAVRDLLLGLAPKDFDVATNATPEQVKRLFRRAFIIGRRFRIVHVVFGRGRQHQVIEVTTFRANVDTADATQVLGNERSHQQALRNVEHAVDTSGRLLRDNVWGSHMDDATRRDFTVNAMYYDPVAQVVVDFHQGLQDVRNKRIRIIGEAALRYREDPVRILRAVRFAAKLAHLGFSLDPATAQPLMSSKPLLAHLPPSRLFDEMLKLLQTGHGVASVQQLKTLQLERGLIPLLDVIVQRSSLALVHAVLQETDQRVQAGKPVIPSYLLACVLWPDVEDRWQHLRSRAQATAHDDATQPPPSNAQAMRARALMDRVLLQQAVDEIFAARIAEVSGRGKLGVDMREIWMLQPHFENRLGKSAFSTVKHLRFRPALGLWRLRQHSDHAEGDTAQRGRHDDSAQDSSADWWERFFAADDEQRKALQAQLRAHEATPKPGPVAAAKPPRKRRARRSKPVGADGAA